MTLYGSLKFAPLLNTISEAGESRDLRVPKNKCRFWKKDISSEDIRIQNIESELEKNTF